MRFANCGLCIVLLACAVATAKHKLAAEESANFEWLVTTHSGNDVLAFDDHGHEHTLVPAGAGGLKGSRGVTVGPGGDLFVACSADDKSEILRYTRTGKPLGVFALGGGLVHPYEAEFGPDGNLYVSGQDNDAVTRYDGRTGRFIDVVVKPGLGGLQTVRGITFAPDGTLLVASRDTHNVLRFDPKDDRFLGEFVTHKSGGLNKPIQLHFGHDGDLYVGSSGNNAILRYDGKTGKPLGAFVESGSGGLRAPSGFAFSPVDGDLYVASRLSNQVLRYSGKTGKFKGEFLPATTAGLVNPEFLFPVAVAEHR